MLLSELLTPSCRLFLASLIESSSEEPPGLVPGCVCTSVSDFADFSKTLELDGAEGALDKASALLLTESPADACVASVACFADCFRPEAAFSTAELADLLAS